MADTSAVAAKLRQLAPRIVARNCQIRSGGYFNPGGSASCAARSRAARTSAEIGPHGLASLRELRDSLPDVAAARQRSIDWSSRREGLDRQDQALEREKGEDDQGEDQAVLENLPRRTAASAGPW